MLASGTTLNHFTILDPIGAGGMGEVYRAKDLKLGREVALKVLPAAFAERPDRLARFEREARVLASLNHSGIAAIHGLEEASGSRFLVLELVEGEGLDEVIARGPVRVQDALRIGTDVLKALAAAHAKGVVHRDLKPANIKITPGGGVKVLDFGLAKALALDSDSAKAGTAIEDAGAASASDSTVAHRSDPATTAPGELLGSPAYMSPEQMRGAAPGPAADLWAFGCLLYELLTGMRAFPAPTISDTIAAVLGREPDLGALPQSTPPSIRELIVACLTKDASRRLGDAGTAARRLEDALLEWRGSAVSASPAAQPKLIQVTFADEIECTPALSADGSELLFCRDVGGTRKIFLKRLGEDAERQLTRGDHDDILPAWSPDGATIVCARAQVPGRTLEPGDVFGEYDDTDVWAVDVKSGRERLLVAGACNPSFSPDGTRIAVDAEWAGPRRIWTVDSNGRNPVQVTGDVSEAVAHIRPRWSPDGERIVFQNIERTKFDIRLVSVRTREMTWITNDLYQDIHPSFGPSGRFIYFSSYRSGGVNVWRIPVSGDGSPVGDPLQVTTGAGQDVEAALSGSRMAFTIFRQNADIWKLPVSPETGLPTGRPQKVIATSREESRGAWSPDGSRVAFNSDRSGDMNVWLMSLHDGAVRQITREAGGDYQPNWSPDSRALAFFSSRDGSPGIWIVELESGNLRRLSPKGGIEINPFFSPDGSLLAYESDRSGRLEVWVMRADGTEARQLTHVGVGGHFLRWTRDGAGVVFRCPTPKPRTLVAPLDGGEPTLLPEVQGGAHMSLSPDSTRIMDVVAHKVLWVSPLEGGAPEPVFEFEDPGVRIDYPVWSPDGRWILFDRFRPQGADVWIMERFE